MKLMKSTIVKQDIFRAGCWELKKNSLTFPCCFSFDFTGHILFQNTKHSKAKNSWQPSGLAKKCISIRAKTWFTAGRAKFPDFS